MMRIDDLSRAHRTVLSTQVQRGRKRVTLEVSVLGHDVWAYQCAKIELQNRVMAERRRAVG